MITSMSLRNYRAFESIDVKDLSRVNLFVGKNGCGKTTLLEAAGIVATDCSPKTLFYISKSRREYTDSSKVELDLSHLFNGHEVVCGGWFEIRGENQAAVSIRCRVDRAETSDANPPTHISAKEFFEVSDKSTLTVTFDSSQEDEPLVAELSPSGEFRIEKKQFDLLRADDDIPTVWHVSIQGFSSKDWREQWEAVAGTPNEEYLIDAVRIVEPDIDGIEFLGNESTGGIHMRMCHDHSFVPLGSFGDGARCLLGLSLAMIGAPRSCVLLDEIDTGLHYSVMSKVWEMVILTAQRLDTQVFATTHSQDCVHALGDLYRAKPELCEDVRLHRVSQDRKETVAYTCEAIQAADKHSVEVR